MGRAAAPRHRPSEPGAADLYSRLRTTGTTRGPRRRCRIEQMPAPQGRASVVPQLLCGAARRTLHQQQSPDLTSTRPRQTYNLRGPKALPRIDNALASELPVIRLCGPSPCTNNSPHRSRRSPCKRRPSRRVLLAPASSSSGGIPHSTSTDGETRGGGWGGEDHDGVRAQRVRSELVPARRPEGRQELPRARLQNPPDPPIHNSDMLPSVAVALTTSREGT